MTNPIQEVEPKLILADVPEAIRAAVAAEASDRDVSINAVVVGVLANRYGVEYEPPSRSRFTGSESSVWVLRVPEVIRDLVRSHAKSLPRGSQRGVVLLALATHYDLPTQSPTRRIEPSVDAEVLAEARARHRAGESLRSLARELGINRDTLTKAVRAA